MVYNDVNCLTSVRKNGEPRKNRRAVFELASESRMSILRELDTKSLKMHDLGRKLDLTTTETFRQLQRLSKTSFVTKNVDGTYSLTPFGKLVLFLSPSFEFIFRHKQYFLEHSIWQLPPEFIFRIGELNKGTFTEQFEAIKRVEEMIKDAEEHIWTLTSQVFAVHGRAVEERFKEGIKFRSLHPKAMFSTELEYPEFKHCIERRYLPEISEVLVITEKEAMLALPLIGGNPDVAAFFGKDPSFKKWATDLYLHYWEQGVTLYKGTKTT
jgi:predicted transcriptional regulator